MKAEVVTAGRGRRFFLTMADYTIILRANQVNMDMAEPGDRRVRNYGFRAVEREIQVECMDDEAATVMATAMFAEHLRALPAAVSWVPEMRADGWCDHSCECFRNVGNGTTVRVMTASTDGYRTTDSAPPMD